MPKIKDITGKIEKLAPLETAMDWDNSGLQLGDPEKQVTSILIAVEPTEKVVLEALEKNCQLLIVHHPLIFQGVKSINLSHPRGSLIARALNNDLAVYAAHTNLDQARGGLNDFLAEKLELKQVENLESALKQEKLVVFVPRDFLNEVQEALFAAGAGNIGNYAEASFYTPGTGTFKPLAGSSPAVGQQDRREEVEEYRLEVIYQARDRSRIIESLKEAHPYEEPAYDIFALEQHRNEPQPARLGRLAEPVSLEKFLQQVKQTLSPAVLRYSGSLTRRIKQVGLACGSGGDFLKEADSERIDLFLTGDVKYHELLEARERGLAVIDAGHFATEKIFRELLASYLAEYFPTRELEIIEASRDESPWQLA